MYDELDAEYDKYVNEMEKQRRSGAFDRVTYNGQAYEKVSGGDAADASWEKGQIASMGFHPIVRQTGEEHYTIYLPTSEVREYEKTRGSEEDAFWNSPEGIAEQRRLAPQIRDYARSPEGRYEKHSQKKWEKQMRREGRL